MQYALVKHINGEMETVTAASYCGQEGDKLYCADHQCGARLKYYPKTRENGATKRPAYFSSIARNDHRAGCRELTYNQPLHGPSIPLRQAIVKGYPVIVSLNDLFGLPVQLWRDFQRAHDGTPYNGNLAAFKRDHVDPQTGEKRYATYSAKSVEDILSLLKTVKRQGTKLSFDKLFFTWQDEVKSYAEFYLDTDTSQIDLFRHLYHRAGENVQHDFRSVVQGHDRAAYGFPRLFHLKPSKRTQQNPYANAVQSTRIMPAKKIPLMMQHQLSMVQAQSPIPRDDMIEDMFVLAVPYVLYERTKSVFNQASRSSGAKFFYTYWSIEATHQFTPAQSHQLVAPNRSQQPAFI